MSEIKVIPVWEIMGDNTACPLIIFPETRKGDKVECYSPRDGHTTCQIEYLALNTAPALAGDRQIVRALCACTSPDDMCHCTQLDALGAQHRYKTKSELLDAAHETA